MAGRARPSLARLGALAGSLALAAAACSADEARATGQHEADSGTDPAVEQGDTGADLRADAGPGYDPRACSTFFVPTAFGQRWRNANHRISLWEVRLEPELPWCQVGALTAAYIGGDWTTGEAQTDVPTVSATVVPVVAEPSTVGAWRQSVVFDLEPPGAAATTVEIDREQAHLLGYAELVPLVVGVRFATDVPQGPDYPSDYEPRLGYTSRGFGAGVVLIEATEQTALVEVDVRFEHGPSDREDMNRAIPLARTRAVVDVLLVGVGRPAVTGRVGYTLQYPRQAIGEDPEHPHASADQQRLTLAGEPGAPAGFVGLQRFDLALSTHGACGPTQECPRGDRCQDGACADVYGPAGLYVRELSVAASLEAFDAETGQASVRVDGYASNASRAFAFYALQHDFDAAVAWLQLPTGAPIHLSEEFETGAARIPLEAP